MTHNPILHSLLHHTLLPLLPTSGSYNIRRQENGEVLFRGHLGASIAGILRADYRMDGQEEVIIISEAGEMVAYLPTGMDYFLYYYWITQYTILCCIKYCIPHHTPCTLHHTPSRTMHHISRTIYQTSHTIHHTPFTIHYIRRTIYRPV
ncbi:hypothetical protein EON63_12635 [archaeon]|nr:MAG: hypothetical protein EON63_12635 [archaeon]